MSYPARVLQGLRGERAAQPQLGPDEKVLAEAPLGADVALLTDRRLIVAGRNFENSFALAQVGLVRSAFRRSSREVAIGTAILLAGLLLLAIAGPLKTMLAAQITSFDAAGAESAGATLAASLLRGARTVVGYLPLAGFALGAIGLVRAAIGVLGQTTVSVHAGGGELQYSRRGRDRALEEFVREVAKALPFPPQRSPARSVAAASVEAGASEPAR
jgi:hypothetical protein